MRTILAVCVALVAVAGCSSSHPSKPAPSLDSSTARQLYLSTVRPLFPASDGDDELVSLGQTVCSLFKSGDTYAFVVEQYVAAGQDPTKTGELIASSVIALCPTYIKELPGGTG